MVWITAAEALGLLNVRAQTLYANVSRGKIRAKRDTKNSRHSLYNRDDVLRLSNRHRGQQKAREIAGETIQWGTPVLPSAISTIKNGRLWYRGQDAIHLSTTCRLEDIADLLWERSATSVDIAHAIKNYPAKFDQSKDPINRALTALAARSTNDPPTYDRPIAELREEAADILSMFIYSLFGSIDLQAENSISAHIAAIWQRPQAEPIIRQALVLIAEHELNASAFATRVTISTGASLAAGVLTGLATLNGPLHGSAAISLAALIETARCINTEAAVHEWVRQERPFPAFGHPLYPDGDPRAEALLNQLPLGSKYVDLASAVECIVGERPNVDFAFAALTDAYQLPINSSILLFAAGRCVGWIAHALEQAETGNLIRPRAHYIGISPAERF